MLHRIFQSAAREIENVFSRRGVASITAWGRRISVTLLMSVSLLSSCGAIWAGPKPPANLSPANLAGRWTGHQFGNTLRVPMKGERMDTAKAPKPMTLTYDIVACGDGWCGIAVTDETACGAVAVKLKPDTTKNRRNAFSGHLELAKGAAPYVVEAWYQAPEDKPADAEAKTAHLNFIGDTGTELLLMRRSFPFQAELARTGDAVCTLEKAVS
jgi:hypothetical protein